MRDIRKLISQRARIPAETVERLRSIRIDWVKGHPKFVKAYEELTVHTTSANERCLVLIVGPTCVGKSTIMRERDAQLVQEAIDAGLPVQGSAYTELNAPNNGKIEVNALYTDVCNHLLLPLANYKIEYKPIKEGAPDVRSGWTGKATRAGLLESIAKGTRGIYPALFLDDASSWALLLKAGRSVEAPFVFKELATKTHRTIVVSGGPETACFQWMTGQMIGRFKLIWMAPYYLENQQDRDDFASLLLSLEEELGEDLIVTGTLQGENADEIMRHTWGTCGIAIDVVLVCVMMCKLKNRKLDWPTLRPYLLENFERCNSVMETEHRFFEAAQEAARRAEYLGFLAHFQKRRRHDVAGEVSLPEMYYGPPSPDVAVEAAGTGKSKNAPGSLGSADNASVKRPSGSKKGGGKGRRKPERSTLNEGAP